MRLPQRIGFERPVCGIAVGRIASPPTIADERIARLRDKPINYIYHESFDEPERRSEILGAAPAAPAQRLAKAPSNVPAYLQGLYGIPLLSAAQEFHLFRKMNYLKYRAARLCRRLSPARAAAREIDRLEDLLQQAEEVRNTLIRSNLRLVISVIKKYVRANVDFSELISDGNISLMRAIDTFDFSRGFKFSTYAYWALRKNFSRTIPAEYSRRERFRTGIEKAFDGAIDDRADECKQEQTRAQQRETVDRILGRLNERERTILICRFGLRPGAEPQTLEQVSARQGVTKERVRQLEQRALEKLRELAAGEVA